MAVSKNRTSAMRLEHWLSDNREESDKRNKKATPFVR